MVPKTAVLRIARPTDQLTEIARLYQAGLGFEQLAAFSDHDGFDGVVLGHPQHPYHLEFTHHRGTRVGGAPTPDNLLVFYVPERDEWQALCQQMLAAGFRAVASYNPYWEKFGKTFEDPDGYRVVIENSQWGE